MKNRVIYLSALLAIAIIAFSGSATDNGTPRNGEAKSRSQYGQIKKSQLSAEEIRKEFFRRLAEDKYWEWKVPIEFYGKVIDQDHRPVADATIHFQWTDLSPKGTSNHTTVSDSNGIFALRGKHGKSLGVRVGKVGYYTVDGGQGMVGFEYASPYEEWFYEPDEALPVIFRLLKKGAAEPLLQCSVELELPGNGSGRAVDLLVGKIAVTGQLQIKTWKPPLSTEPIPKPYDWRIIIEIPGGGFVEHQDTFPFTAPEAGYVSSVDLHMSPDLGPQWRVGIEKNYYFRFGTSPRYGRLILRTNGDSKVVFVDYYLNPKPGSRNLEFDPSKTAMAVKP
jgi:hypothetical protein